MARARPPLAQRLRAHREELALSIELGCTPREARAELDRRAAWDRHQQLMARAAATLGRASHRSTDPEPPRPTPWWQRD